MWVIRRRHQARADELAAQIGGEMDELDWRHREDTETFDSDPVHHKGEL
jgi:hypothetical protein